MTKYGYKKALKSLFVLITKQAKEKRNLGETAKLLRSKIGQFEGLNKFEKYRIYSACYGTARVGKHKGWEKRFATNKVFDEMFKACRGAFSAARMREKKAVLKEEMDGGETIFFLCSSHRNSAPDHEPYQGKMYIDRFWRGKVDGKDYRAVLLYVRNHDVQTVQEILGDPVYLTTRPYCKHYFIPIPTATVLGSSVRKIRSELEKKKKTTDYRQEYYEVRTAVYTELNKVAPCKEFERIAIK